MVVLAGPVIVGEAAHAAFHLVDVAIVGPLGSWATGAIMTSMFTLWIAFSLASLITTGLGAHVSQAVGEGDLVRAGHVAGQSLWLCLLLGVPAAALGYLG